MRKIFLGFLLSLLLMPTIIIAQDTEFREPNWWEERVWYSLYVRSFNDSDGDGIGDFQGVIERLDYLNDGDPNTTDDLGIGGIWLLPIAESDTVHGYHVTDYFAVEEDYGTAEDFQQLVDEAHARGIAIIVDFVVNHTSDQHPWFIASAEGDPEFADWYVWEDENPNFNGPWGARAWYQNNTRDAWYYAPFNNTAPDLNHENPAVTDAIYEAATFWIEEYGIDGYRLDAVRYLLETEINGLQVLQDLPENRAYLADLNDHIHMVDPDAFVIGEIFTGSTNTIAKYTEEGAVDAAFEFVVAQGTDATGGIISAASTGNKRPLEQVLPFVFAEYQGGQFATFVTNHDQTRLFTEIDGDVGVNKVVANLLMTLPGFPFLYYGEEIGLAGPKLDGDAEIRRPMQWDASEGAGFTTGTPWNPLPEDYADRTVANQTDDPDSLLSHYRELIHLRNSQPALQYGETILVDSTYRASWGYLRYTADETLLVVMNLDDRESREYTFTIDEGPLENVSSIDVIYSTTDVEVNLPEINANGGFTDYVPIDAPLPPFSLYVLRLNN
ncbi:MAG: alpha-amylase family glycosyl hydrolase [Chloroflexota bacterium]